MADTSRLPAPPGPGPTLPLGAHLPEHQGHRVWWCEAGAPAGLPVLVLHGGPGGRTRAASLAWFEGSGARCIALDQRGCGQSEPVGGLQANTLDHLLQDIERLRIHLGLSAWAVAGGSWGALVAVAYAGTHPQRCLGLFLRSSFLGSDDEVGAFFEPWPVWLGVEGARWLGAARAAFPLEWLQPESAAPADGRGVSRMRLARAWQDFEHRQSRPGGVRADPPARFEPPADRGAVAAAPAAGPVLDALPPDLAVQCHYLANHCFVTPERVAQWLDCIDLSLAGSPMCLVHGLADAVCHPSITAKLAGRWPWARTDWVADAGHGMDAEPMRRVLTAAACRWVAELRAGAGPGSG